MSITFKVNGQSRTVDVPADMPLLWVLRDVLDMKGTKFGCGIGQCRACTVHVNGTAVMSCRRTVSNVAGAEVTTIEGLSPDGSHPLQKAWQELDVPQCGYSSPARSCRRPRYSSARQSPPTSRSRPACRTSAAARRMCESKRRSTSPPATPPLLRANPAAVTSRRTRP